MNDSLALVRVKGFKGVTVEYNNQRMGRTNRNGEIVVPDIISYYPNTFSFNADDLPLNYEVGATTKYASTSFRGAGVVEFETKKVQGVVGRFLVSDKGERVGVEYGELKVYVGGGTIGTVVGAGGEFYLENLPAGAHPARLTLRGLGCAAEIVIPKSEEMFLDIGEVVCDVD